MVPGLTKYQDQVFDLLVVGLGPAGVACALQARRDGLTVVAVSEESPGGLLAAARRLDNFPGLSPVAGARLAEMLQRQIERQSLALVKGRVTWLERPVGLFEVLLQEGEGNMLRARAVVLAVGTEPRPWRLSSDGPLHRDVRTLEGDLRKQRVVVVGGGEAALDSALSCRDRGARVVVLMRGRKPRATARLIEEIQEAGIEVEPGIKLRRVARHAGRWQLRAENGRAFTAEQLLVCIGRRPRLELLRGLGARPGRDLAARGCRGLFLAGDVIRGRERYAAAAMGDGQRAALAARDFLSKEAGA